MSSIRQYWYQTLFSIALLRYDHNLTIGSNVHVADAKTGKTPQMRAPGAHQYSNYWYQYNPVKYENIFSDFADFTCYILF